jgi:hypothetical protein
MDAIDRICDFATGTGSAPSGRVRQGIATLAHSFDRARTAATRVRQPNTAASNSASRELSELDMGGIVRPYGFVVRIDADAVRDKKPALKLLRFNDRSNPVGIFESFAALMEWLAARADRAPQAEDAQQRAQLGES